jgi:hypothetical protein
LAYGGLVPRLEPFVDKPCYHTASTHDGVDLASSDERKALGVDGHPIVPHWQIQWVYIN